MSQIYFIIKKELKIYFSTPMAYAVYIIFLFLSGFFFFNILYHTKEASLHYLFGNMSLTLLFITPLVTMRSFSEERHSGTIELLMTAPISELEVVLGKYLASLLAIVGMLILTLLYPIWILIVGTPDRGPIICGYIGMLFLSGSFIAVGILCSAFTRNQIVAGVLTLGALIFLWAIDWVSESVKSTLGKEILTNLSLLKHYEDFRKGLIDTKHIVFYLGFIFYFLFLSIRVIRARKWR